MEQKEDSKATKRLHTANRDVAGCAPTPEVLSTQKVTKLYLLDIFMALEAVLAVAQLFVYFWMVAQWWLFQVIVTTR